jgi:predicted sulfurtransferase
MEAKEQEYGVLLYYKYAEIPDVKSTVDFYDSNCRSLGLVGRVRIAPDGVNVTVPFFVRLFIHLFLLIFIMPSN